MSSMIRGIIFTLAVLIIGTYITWFIYPDNFLNNSSLGLIRYFNVDEFGLVAGTIRLCAHPFKSPQWYNAYPQLFYYLTLILLWPFFIFKGADPSIIINEFRMMNVFSFYATLILMLLFSRRFFKSFIPGAIAVCLSLTTPAAMGNLIWSRPDAFEYLLIFSSLFFFSEFIANKNKVVLLWWGIIMSALAFTTKYGGIFLIPQAVVLLFKSVTEKRVDPLKALKISSIVNMAVKWIVLFAIPIISAVSYWGIFCYQSKKTGLSLWEGGNLGAIRILSFAAFALVGFLIIYVAILHYLGLVSRRQLVVSPKTNSYRLIYNLYYVISVFNFIMLIFGVVYLFFNPYIVTDTLNFLSVWGVRILGPFFGCELDKRPGLFSGLFWPKMLLDGNLLMGRAVGTLVVIFIMVAFIKIVRRRDSDNEQKIFMLLLSYAAILLAFLFLLIRHPGCNFAVPAVITLYLCTGYGAWYLFRDKRLKYLTSVIVFSIVVLRFPSAIIEYKQGKGAFSWKNDPVYKVTAWLEKNIVAGSSIMTDTMLYYVPSKFKKIVWEGNAYKGLNQRLYFDPKIFKDTSWMLENAGKISQMAPDVFIRVDATGLKSVIQVNEEYSYLLRNYNLVASFDDNSKILPSKTGHIFIYKRKL